MSLIGKNINDYHNVVDNVKDTNIDNNGFKMSMRYIIELKDDKGKVIKTVSDVGHSLTVGWLYWIALLLLGTESSISFSGIGNSCNTWRNYVIYNIAVGSGSQSFSPSLNSLGSEITDLTPTTGASVSYAYIVGSGYRISFYQEISNSTNNTYNITEVGLKMSLYAYNCSTVVNLGSYDVLQSPLTLSPGYSLNITIIVDVFG